MNKNRIFNLIVLLTFSVFIDYDVFIFVAICIAIFFVKDIDKLELNKTVKLILNIQIFCFIFLVRYIPILNNKFLRLYNFTSQKNYLLFDGKYFSENIFYDLQTFLYGLYCNSELTEYSSYVSRYEEIYISCPFGSGYGIFTKFIYISQNVWTTTLFLSIILLIILWIIFLYELKSASTKKFLLYYFFLLSPPVNFLLFRLNTDLVIFLTIFILLRSKKVNNLIRNLILLILTFIKIYPFFLIVGYLFKDILKQKKFNQIGNIFTLILGFIYIIYDIKIGVTSNNLLKNEQSNISFGILNDSIYLSEIFNVPLLMSLLLIISLIIFISFFTYKYYVLNFEDIDLIPVYFLILGLGLFINYDYKLIFLFFLMQPVWLNSQKHLMLLFIFLYSSPSLLHSYSKFYKLIVNDEIYFFDFSFYFFYSIVLINFIKYFPKYFEIFVIQKNLFFNNKKKLKTKITFK